MLALRQAHFVLHFILRLSVEGSDLGVEDRPKGKVEPMGWLTNKVTNLMTHLLLFPEKSVRIPSAINVSYDNGFILNINDIEDPQLTYPEPIKSL